MSPDDNPSDPPSRRESPVSYFVLDEGPGIPSFSEWGGASEPAPPPPAAGSAVAVPAAAPAAEPPRKSRAGLLAAAVILAVGMVVSAWILRPLPTVPPDPPPPTPAAPDTSTAPIPEPGPPKTPPDAPAVAISAPSPSPPTRLTLELGDGVTLECILVPAGTFRMGSPVTEDGRGVDEILRVTTLTRPFYLAARETTQAQYQAVTGTNPAAFVGANRPVESVSWNEADAFCRLVSEKTGRRVRLPTEAEWEYACRAGTATPFNTGTTLLPGQANFDPGAPDGTARKRTEDAGHYAPNAWGFYDMHGNVQEWCSDGYDAYVPGQMTDPRGPETASGRVLRGGGWRHPADKLRSAARAESPPEGGSRVIGFRVVVEP